MAIAKKLHTLFGSVGPTQQDDGTITSGTASESNRIILGGIPFEQFVIGTQSVVVPAQSTLGVDIVQTDTNGQGMALAPHSNSLASPLKFVIGTDPAFFIELVVQVTDWSGCRLMVGFHGGASGTIQAQQTVANFGNYTDLALIGNYAGGAVDVYTQQCINDTAPTDTDTTINLTDGDVAKLRVNVSAAGVVSYALSLAATATPTAFVAQTLTVPVAQTFDSTDNVVPLILLVNHTDTASAVILKELTIGLQ
jgi:hypothetical protein